MLIRTLWLVLSLFTLLLAACGQPAPEDLAEEPVAGGNPSAAVGTATSEPTATSMQSTATPVPSATPEPTAQPTATSGPTSAPLEVQAPEAAPAAAADVNDTPQLSEETAPPRPETLAVAPAQPSEPVRLIIPAIALDYQPVSVGLDQHRVPVVPKHDVGWYNLSARPGEGENIVFWGHVLRFKSAPRIPAPFARLKELQPGAELIIKTAGGEEARYRVTQHVQVTPDQVEYILPTGKEQVTLVSCIGENVIEGGELTKKYRLITIAEPVR